MSFDEYLLILARESLLDDAWEREGRIADPSEFSDERIQARAEWISNQKECFQ